jgi:hypothetical protein
VRNLLKILLGGFLVFMLLAIAQEWEFFSTAWFGSEPEAVVLSEEAQAGAVAAVEQTLQLMGHFYGTGGDPRFAERIPASEAVLAEMAEDIDYLRRNHRRQEPSLQGLEILSVRALDEMRAEVRTKEFWIHRVYWITDGGEAEPPHSQVLWGTYLVAHRGQKWRVEGWEVSEPPRDRGVAGEG